MKGRFLLRESMSFGSFKTVLAWNLGILSFVLEMKDILLGKPASFGLHHADEGHFACETCFVWSSSRR